MLNHSRAHVISSPAVNETESIACEIVTTHLDALHQFLMAFQQGQISRAELQRRLLAHASAIDEAHETLRSVDSSRPPSSRLPKPIAA